MGDNSERAGHANCLTPQRACFARICIHALNIELVFGHFPFSPIEISALLNLCCFF